METSFHNNLLLKAVSLKFCLSANIVILNTKTTLDTIGYHISMNPMLLGGFSQKFRLIAVNILRI